MKPVRMFSPVEPLAVQVRDAVIAETGIDLDFTPSPTSDRVATSTTPDGRYELAGWIATGSADHGGELALGYRPTAAGPDHSFQALPVDWRL